MNQGEISPIKFSCVNNECIHDSNGEFNTVNECLHDCQRFDCNAESGQCIENGKSGKFSSLSECSSNCGSRGSSLLLPKTNLSNKDYMNEIQITKTLNGSLQSAKLKIDSSYIHLLFDTLLVITIISILGYYLFNKKNDLMSTGIALVLSIILLYVICKYIYDNYINVAKIYH